MYADASALVKLFVREGETAGLLAYLNETKPLLTTSVIAIVEVLRAVRIAGSGTEASRLARQRLDETRFVELDRSLVDEAVSLTSARVRSLDAIHLASAFRVGAREMLVYDRRLAEAAEVAGIRVLSPGCR